MATTTSSSRSASAARSVGAVRRAKKSQRRSLSERSSSAALRSPAAAPRPRTARVVGDRSTRPLGAPAPRLGAAVELRAMPPRVDAARSPNRSVAAVASHSLAVRPLAVRPLAVRRRPASAGVVLTDRGWWAVMIGLGLLAVMSVAVMVASFLSVSNAPLV